MNALYGSAIVGLCLLRPIKNYYFSQPIKLYEYMAAGIPFVCSDFPVWESIARESGAGVCVDIHDVAAIQREIRFFLENRDAAQEMGRRGREYVEKHCNWDTEAFQLIRLYNMI